MGSETLQEGGLRSPLQSPPSKPPFDPSTLHLLSPPPPPPTSSPTHPPPHPTAPRTAPHHSLLGGVSWVSWVSWSRGGFRGGRRGERVSGLRGSKGVGTKGGPRRVGGQRSGNPNFALFFFPLPLDELWPRVVAMERSNCAFGLLWARFVSPQWQPKPLPSPLPPSSLLRSPFEGSS